MSLAATGLTNLTAYPTLNPYELTLVGWIYLVSVLAMCPRRFKYLKSKVRSTRSSRSIAFLRRPSSGPIQARTTRSRV